jgi:hypothetical protein
MNNGSGHFLPANNKIPNLLKNKSCASATDIDKDGDIDLFVGGLVDAKQFGKTQPSYLLLNDGKANFTTASSAVIDLANMGMVTSASFADMNKDGWMDLVVTGEWMPLKIFINKNGKFTSTDIPTSTGLWQTIYTADINEDGHTDILAGNWGHNSKLWAGKDGPLKLYVKDFDGNGSVEQVMAYTVAGEEYTFLAKDELERALPVLKKHYLQYSEVAGKTVQYMFYDLFKDYTELKAETLSSSAFINDGKGNFTRIELPAELQLAPVFSFASIKPGNFLAAGNFYGTIPYEGRYDALCPGSISFDKTKNNFTITKNMIEVDGEVRDMKWLALQGNNPVLMIARNNKPLSFYQLVNN